MMVIFRRWVFLFLACGVTAACFAQPYVDPVSFTARYFRSQYKAPVSGTNITADYNLNLFFPKEFKNGNAFFIRIGAEQIHSENHSTFDYKYNLYSVAMPLGFQVLSKTKKWKSMVMAIPRYNSDFRDDLSKDFVMGGTVLETYTVNDKLKFKLGLYYSREFWGNFFIPLAGIDWKINDHLSMYGIMPSNYRIEYRFNNKLYAGLGFKSFQRSYRLAGELNNDYVRMKDTQLKCFIDYFIYKKVLVFADVAYGLQYSLVEYAYDHASQQRYSPIYSPFNHNLLFTAGVAYRIRMDLKP